MRLENKVAIVTGSSRGIGRAIALAFAKEGANVAINYLQSEDKAMDVVRQILNKGGCIKGSRSGRNGLTSIRNFWQN